MSILFQKANLTDKSLNLTNFNRMVDYVGRLANMSSPNMTIDQSPTGYVLKVKPSSTSTMSYSDWAFGFSISGAVVTVNQGRVRQGTRAPRVTAPTTAITITADLTWIYCYFVLGGSGGDPSVLSSLSEPLMNETELKFPLHTWRVINGTVSLGVIHHLGDIIIPGNFA